jgi:putative membrane protein
MRKEMNDTAPNLADVLATERTRMAADRTLMGWVRTALSMIGFGFTIFKFLESIQARESVSDPIRQQAPRAVGVTLLSIGLFSLVVACLQHWNYVKTLKSDKPYRPWDLAFVVAFLIGLLGLAMLVSIILRAGPLG